MMIMKAKARRRLLAATSSLPWRRFQSAGKFVEAITSGGQQRRQSKQAGAWNKSLSVAQQQQRILITRKKAGLDQSLLLKPTTKTPGRHAAEDQGGGTRRSR
jgi:hypothetical protein